MAPEKNTDAVYDASTLGRHAAREAGVAAAPGRAVGHPRGPGQARHAHAVRRLEPAALHGVRDVRPRLRPREGALRGGRADGRRGGVHAGEGRAELGRL